MSNAIQLIVAGYVKIKARRALEGLRNQRRKLLACLQAIIGISAVIAIDAVQVEMATIELGLEELKTPSGTVPDSEWR